MNNNKITAKTLADYEAAGYKVIKVKTCRPQLNMELATIEAEKLDRYNNNKIRKYIILLITNNNCQFETIIPKEAWNIIK